MTATPQSTVHARIDVPAARAELRTEQIHVSGWVLDDAGPIPAAFLIAAGRTAYAASTWPMASGRW